jgi:acetyltransferase-like isoleucine patch superfamily enzyme
VKKIYIIGGDGFARECYYNIISMAEHDPHIVFGGFLGHGGYGKTVDYKDLQPLYLGEEAEHQFKENEYVVIGAGYPEIRRKIYNDLKKRNAQFFTICLGKPFKESLEHGEANTFVPPFDPSCNITIGNGNVFNGSVIVGHDVTIGDFNFFGPHSIILGRVAIGNDNTIGANAVILPGAKVGHNNKIAPLSAIYKGCRDNSYLLGNPAVKVGAVKERKI